MSSDLLPDNPDQWPDDPFDLLGVSRSADVAAIRRNYAALIRRWRPEQHPAEFRKIRDAYESASSYARYWNAPSFNSQPEEQKEHEEQEAQAGDTTEGTSETPPTPAPASRLISLNEQLHAAWQLARQGQLQNAYDVLLRLQREHGVDTDVPLRLYWLLKIHRELDTAREPLDWLAHSLRSAALRGPSAELYRRELDRNPKEALSDRCGRLLELPASAAAISQLAVCRWKAAGLLGCHRLIQDDLERLRPVVSSADDEQWLHLLTAAAEQLAWAADSESQAAFEHSCEEIEALTHFHTTRSHDFDRLEMLRELARSWGALNAQARPVPASNGMAGQLEPLVPLWWHGHRERLRPLLLPVIAQIVKEPGKTLSLLTSWESNHSVLVAQIAEMLHWFANRQHSSEGVLPAAAEVRPLVEQWLWPQNGATYNYLRPLLLEFCVQLAIDPETVGEVAEQTKLFHLRDHQSFAHQVEGDSPLRAVFGVCMSF